VSRRAAAPRGRVHCNDLRSEHRSSVIAVRPPSRDQSPCPARGLAGITGRCYDTRQQKKPQTRAAEVPPGASRAPARLLRWTVLENGPSLRTGNRIFGGRSGVSTIPGVEHLLSVALDTTSRRTLADGRSVCKSVPFGAGIGLCLPFWVADARGSLSWTPLRGADASARRGLALRAQTCRSSGVDTTHRPGGSRALSSSRATHFPNPPEFWSVVRHRFNRVAMT